MGDKYKLTGSRTAGEKVDQIILKGSSVNPEEVLELNGPGVELSEEQYNELNVKYVLEPDSETGEASEQVSAPRGSRSSTSEKSNN